MAKTASHLHSHSHISPTHPESAAFCDALAGEIFGDLRILKRESSRHIFNMIVAAEIFVGEQMAQVDSRRR